MVCYLSHSPSDWTYWCPMRARRFVKNDNLKHQILNVFSGLMWSILALVLTIIFTLVSIIFNAFFIHRESPFLFGKSIEDLTGVEVPELVEPQNVDLKSIKYKRPSIKCLSIISLNHNENKKNLNISFIADLGTQLYPGKVIFLILSYRL